MITFGVESRFQISIIRKMMFVKERICLKKKGFMRNVYHDIVVNEKLRLSCCESCITSSFPGLVFLCNPGMD